MILDSITTSYKELGFFQAQELWEKCKNPMNTNKNQIITSILTKIKNLTKIIIPFLDRNEQKTFTNNNEKARINEKELTEINIAYFNKPENIHFDEKAITNLTNIEIPRDILLTMSWGNKFLFPYILDEHNTPMFMSQIEHVVDTIAHPASIRHVAIGVKNILKTNRNCDASPITRWLNFTRYRTEQFLKTNKNVRFLTADKGKITVIIDIQTYEEKLEDHLNDERYYKKCNFDPLDSLVDKEKAILEILSRNEHIKNLNVNLKYEDKCMKLPVLYGVIKPHKNNKIRPITSNAGNVVGQKTNNILKEILTEIFPPSNQHVLNSIQVKEFINKTKLPVDHVLVSFDATSMFTNISSNMIKNIIVRKLDIIKTKFHINGVTFMKILHFTLVECRYFRSLDKIYLQKEGLPMGGSISSICCRLVMDEIIKNITPKPFFIKIYVDDTLLAIHKDCVETTMDSLNKQYPNIQFTCEQESNNRVNFLNLTIFRDNTNLYTNWYKKQIASSRLINWYSSHNRSVILNTAIRFIKTIIELSDEIFFESNKQIIINTLMLNCFPDDKIQILINDHYTYMKPANKRNINTNFAFELNKEKTEEFKKKWFETRTKIKQNNEIPTYIPLPYINQKCNQIRNLIEENQISGYKITNSYKNSKINFIKNIKGKNDVMRNNNAIAKFDCECNKYTKIKTTEYNQNLAMLIDEHIEMGKCRNNRHIYTKTKIIKGLTHKYQTRNYLKHLQWKYRNKIIDKTAISFPYPQFR